MNVLIYDNSNEDSQKLKKMIINLFSTLKLDCSIHITNDYGYLIDNIMDIDMLFLDIELDDRNGIELGKEIKKINQKCRIIITSQFNKYLIDGYKIHADRYFLKPINEHEFNLEMKIVVREYFKQYFSIHDQKICSYPIYLKDILYIEAHDKTTVIYLVSEKQIKTPYRLKYWIDKLNGYNFAQSHKAFLVNLSYISSLKQRDVLLLTNQLIPLSRNYRKTFEESFTESLYNNLC